MALGASSDLDRRLRQIYASKVTVNLENASNLTADDIWKSLEMIAYNNKTFMKKV